MPLLCIKRPVIHHSLSSVSCTHRSAGCMSNSCPELESITQYEDAETYPKRSGRYWRGGGLIPIERQLRWRQRGQTFSNRSKNLSCWFLKKKNPNINSCGIKFRSEINITIHCPKIKKVQLSSEERCFSFITFALSFGYASSMSSFKQAAGWGSYFKFLQHHELSSAWFTVY